MQHILIKNGLSYVGPTYLFDEQDPTSRVPGMGPRKQDPLKIKKDLELVSRADYFKELFEKIYIFCNIT